MKIRSTVKNTRYYKSVRKCLKYFFVNFFYKKSVVKGFIKFFLQIFSQNFSTENSLFLMPKIYQPNVSQMRTFIFLF